MQHSVRLCGFEPEINWVEQPMSLKFQDSRIFYCQFHGGTTEEGNCSYPLPREAADGSDGTNKGQIRAKFPG